MNIFFRACLFVYDHFITIFYFPDTFERQQKIAGMKRKRSEAIVLIREAAILVVIVKSKFVPKATIGIVNFDEILFSVILAPHNNAQGVLNILLLVKEVLLRQNRQAQM